MAKPAKCPTPAKSAVHDLSKWKDPNYKADIGRLMHENGRWDSRNPEKRAANKTQANKRLALERAMNLLTERKRNFQTLSQLKPTHIPELIALWMEARVSEATQVQYFSALRWFWRQHGIQVETIKHFAVDPDIYIIRSAAQTDRSVSIHVPDVLKFIDAMEAVDERFRWFCLLSYAAGFRKQECLCLDPHNNDLGTHIKITAGAKGGRPRTVNLQATGEAMYALARAAIDGLKQLTPMGSHAGWPGKSLAQNLRYFSRMSDKVGLTKEKLGTTFHGLRHDYAINGLEMLTGQTAPVRGGDILNYRRYRDHQLTISKELGHNRPKVTNAYYGSFPAMVRRAKNNFIRDWSLLEPHLERVKALMIDLGVAPEIYMIGSRAMGLDTKSTEPFHLQLAYGLSDSLAGDVSRTIGAYLTNMMGVGVMVSPNSVTDASMRAELLVRAFALFVPPQAAADETQANVDDAQINRSRRPAGVRPIEEGYRRHPTPSSESAGA